MPIFKEVKESKVSPYVASVTCSRTLWQRRYLLAGRVDLYSLTAESRSPRSLCNLHPYWSTVITEILRIITEDGTLCIESQPTRTDPVLALSFAFHIQGHRVIVNTESCMHANARKSVFTCTN